jgi:PEP-CTERM motif
LGRIGFERQSETSKLVLQVEESWDLFILKELHRGGSNNPLKYNSFHNVTFGTQITTRPVTSFAQFNPANGTLTDIMTTITGPATWTSSSQAPSLFARLTLHNSGEEVNNGQTFGSPGAITINFGGTDTFIPDFTTSIGTGTTTLDFKLLGEPGDTFETTAAAGLVGSINYDYTPSAVVPEPGSLALLGAGLAGFAFVRRRKNHSFDI